MWCILKHATYFRHKISVSIWKNICKVPSTVDFFFLWEDSHPLLPVHHKTWTRKQTVPETRHGGHITELTPHIVHEIKEHCQALNLLHPLFSWAVLDLESLPLASKYSHYGFWYCPSYLWSNEFIPFSILKSF